MSDMLNKLVGKLSERNPQLAQKLQEKVKEKAENMRGGSNNLEDKLDFNPTGELKIETIDSEGNVLKTVEEENLVVDESLDIILRGLAADAKNSIYLCPALESYGTWQNPPTDDDIKWELKVEPHYLVQRNHSNRGGSWQTYHQIKAEVGNSFEADNILAKPTTIPDTSINFIGLGISELRYLNNDNKALNYAANWTHINDSKYKSGTASKTTTTGDTVAIEDSTDKLKLYYTVHPEGGKAEITVDGQLIDTIDTYSANEQSGFEQEIDMSQAPAPSTNNGNRNIVIEHIGTSNTEVTTSTFIFEGIEKAGYDATTTSLSTEVPQNRKVIDEPEYYNTTNSAPYTFFLDLKSSGNSVIPDSVKMFVNGEEYTKVDTAPTPDSKEYRVKPTGEVTVGREVRNAAVTYELDNAFPTNYQRAEIAHPIESAKNYPIYSFARDEITFEAEFKPDNPNFPVVVKELALFNLPLARRLTTSSGSLNGEKMFSITDVSDIRKDPENGLRVEWTIKFNKTN